MTSYILFIAACLTICADGQDRVYHECIDFPMVATSQFEFSCDGGKIIIVKSAIIGVTDQFNPPHQCPITNNTCLKETTIAAELCTGRNSCVINQNFLLANESKIPCSYSGTTVVNFININYTCIIPGPSSYGDICHFDEALYSNDAVYISSFRNFPDVMGPEANYQCSCRFTSLSSSSSDYVTIRVLLVKLTGAVTTCSERFSILDSKNHTGLTFCSPCNNANKVTTIPVASNILISFRRDPYVSPFNGKFLLEITVSSKSSGSGPVSSMKCGYVDSAISTSTSVSTMSPLHISTTKTSAIFSQPNGFSSTTVQNTSLGSTLRSNDPSANTQQNTLSSSNTQNAALFSSTAPSNGDGRPTPDNQTASEQKSISTGAIVGIVLGVFGFLAVLLLASVFAIKYLRSKQKGSHSTELMPQASDPRLNPSSVNKKSDYENTAEVNGLQVNRTRNSQFPNMQEGEQGPPEHTYYNESISTVMPLPDNNNHYEPLRVTNNQQQTYYNHPAEENSYQQLSLP